MSQRQSWLAVPWPLGVSLCGFALLWVLAFGDPLEGPEMRWLDRALRWRTAEGAAPASDPHVVHLDINRQDLKTMPTLESEYETAARIIREASQRGAKVIVFDVIFERGTSAMAKPILDAIAEARNQNCAVVLAEAVLPPINGQPQRARSFLFRERYEHAGLINVQADGDGVFRRYALIHETGGTLEPSLALAAYLAWQDKGWDKVVKPRGAAWDELGADMASSRRRKVPIEPAILNIRSAWETAFRHRSLGDFFQSADRFQNSVIVVSYIGAGVGDLGSTAFGPAQPRVLLHSTALNDLMQSSPLRRAPRWGDALVLITVILLGSAMPLCPRKRWLLGLWLLGLAAILGAGLALIFKAGLVVANICTAALWTLTIVVEVARRHTRESAERQRIRNTMGLYFSPRVLKDVLENPGRLEPKRLEITVLLTDLRNSTPIAERLGAEGMLALLNRVFEVQTCAVFAKEGSLETPVGDQFLAYWGAPEPQPDSADRAMSTALAIIEGMDQLRASLEPEIRELFGFGVGLHAGPSLIGNIGSSQFFHYGPVGDLINSAARIEALTKHYGVLIIVTREVYSKLSAPPPARVLDQVIVKGKRTSLELIEVQHRFNAEGFAERAAKYEAAFALYHRGEFTEAAAGFEALAGMDKPSALLAARCRALAADAPPEWDGIYKLETK
jgi:adenylate cyclase